jgi:hypothetical protein
VRYELNGTSLWHGTVDAPAPEGDISASASGRLTGATINIAVKPTQARYTVELRYRVNGGGVIKKNAALANTNLRGNTQYFAALLPVFQVGDKVEYIAVAKWPKGQIPAEGDATFRSSFTVVAASAASRTTPSHAKLNSAVTGASRSSSRETHVPFGIAANGARTLGKAQLLALARSADSTVSEIQRADPGLGTYLAGKIGAQRKTNVLRGMTGASRALRDALPHIDYAPTEPDRATIGQAIITGLGARKVAQPILREATATVSRLERAGRLADVAGPETPVARHPLFQEEMNRAALYKLTDSVKLGDAKAQRLTSLGGSPALVDDQMLTSLVADKVFSEAEANALGLVLSLCLLAGGNVDLAIAIRPHVAGLTDIATVSTADWLAAIKATRASPPDGLDTSAFAAALRRAAGNLYPTDALQAASIPADLRLIEAALKALAPLADKNAKLVGTDFDALNKGGVGDIGLAALSEAHRQLQALVGRHPGLGLADVLNGHDPPAEKIAELSRRLDLLKKLRAQNPEHEFMGLDYTEGSADRAGLNTDGLSDSDVHMAVADLKASQRMHTMTKDVDHAGAMMAGGYGSACAVAMDDPDDVSRKTGLDAETVRHYHKKATKALSRASHGVVTALGAYDGPFHRMPVGNVRSGIKDHLQSIPGFSALFGSQDYCNCTECQSILGAPAYFVDLMTFIEDNLTGRVFRGRHADNPLNLKVRRPDLWTLPLTCANTNTLVSYLDIINPTLENYIALRHHGFKGSLSDRAPIETMVYQDALAAAKRSFQQPFFLPLETLDIYLEHFKISRLQIARLLGAAPAVIVKAGLKISEPLYQQLVNVSHDHAFPKDVYGLPLSFAGGTGHVTDQNVKDLLAPTGYSRAAFEAAATTRFVTKDGATKIRIRSERKNAESVQNDVEKISGLTADALSRLYQFTRLLRAVNWTVSDLDMILAQLGAVASGIEQAVLYRIVQVLDLRKRWSIPVDQLCTLWTAIPTTPKSASLFDRLFNFTTLAQKSEPLPQPDVRFVHPAFSDAGTALTVRLATHATGAPVHGVNMMAQLLAGLQVSETDLANTDRKFAVDTGCFARQPCG